MVLGADGATSSNSPNSTRRCKYDVFLSFRGEDTRKNFTDHLYAALEGKGIITFRDDEKLERGQVIKPNLLQAIEESLSAVVVLSPNYASSTWCLDELEKILRTRNEVGLQVFPIFYGVDPSDVRNQRGSFEEAFRRHDEKFTEDREKVQRWRYALKEVANLSGWDSKDWHETRLIEEVTEDVWSKLDHELLSDPEILVGIKSKIEEMDSLIMKFLNDVRIIGIWGMGGIGKTTLARAVYEKIKKDFDISCFLPNIKEIFEKSGLIHLQRELLSRVNYKRTMEINDCYDGKRWIKRVLHNKKVLIVLDDVSDISQLNNLAEKKEWFGPGSIVIITTRDAHLLTLHGVFEKYEIKILSNDESLQLFCQNAFKGDQPTEGYLELSRRVVEYADGLPLALKVLGSFLCGKTVCEWTDALDKLSKIPPNDIMKKLKLSYDGLENAEKNIFLDIACFFKKMPKDWVIGILKNCGFYPTIGIKVLIEKSMLVDCGNYLDMHDLLQEMGKSIVFQESPPSRLWTLEDSNKVLKKNKGTEVIQCIVLYLPQPSNAHWDPEAFSNMWNLRLLMISNLNLPRGIKCFPPALKVLKWVGYPLDALPQGVQLDELVDFNMQRSKIKQLWKGTQFLEKLKFINLSYCIDLIKTPNFIGIPNLERLELEGCKNLVEVHHSVGQHKKLIIINLKDCISLQKLPGKLEIDSLETFILSGCSKVRKLPDFAENMKRLSTLSLEETAIIKLPQSLAYLTGVAILNLRNCKSLLCLPNVLQNLKYIKSINISGCSKIESLSDNWNENKALEELDVSGTAIKEVPSSIFHLENLKYLSFSGCKGRTQRKWPFKFNKPPIPTKLILPLSWSSLSLLWRLNLSYCNINEGSVLKDISRLPSLEVLNLSGNNFVNLPVEFMSNLLKLKYLCISHCPRLQSLLELPPNVETTIANDCPSMGPLLDTKQLGDLFASLNLQSWQSYHRDYGIHLTLPGKEIPSWYHNQNCSVWRTISPNRISSIVSFIADIPYYCRSSEWLGIAVCLVLQADVVSVPSLEEQWIHYTCTSHGHEFRRVFLRSCFIDKQYNSADQLHLFYFPWNFVRSEKLQLRFILSQMLRPSVHKQKMPVNWEIKRCGWRVLCKEDIEAWHQTRSEGYSSSSEFASQHLDGLNEVRIREDTLQNQCHHEISEEDGATSHASTINKTRKTAINASRLQSLPELLPNAETINASNCASMEPLLDTQLWDLFASLELQYHSHDPIKLTLPRKEIPSWFHNQNNIFGREMGSFVSKSVVSFVADIPNYCLSSKWWGIAICLALQADIVSAPSIEDHWIYWRHPDVHPMHRRGYPINGQCNSADQLYIFYIPYVLGFNFFNDIVCTNKVKLEFSIEKEQKTGVHKQKMLVNWEIKGCGWRVLCKEDMEAWCQTRSDDCSNNIEFTSQHLDGVRITEDIQQTQCHHEITEENGANSYAKHNQQDK